MSRILQVNIEDLLRCQGVESARVEFKASWDENTTGYQVLKTLCAFANDFQNLNGGYVVIGVAEQDGCALLPPKGLVKHEIDAMQKWIRGNCNRIDPVYQPVISPETVDGKNILVLWAPGSDVRPHRAPSGRKGDYKYFIRIGSESVDAEKRGLLNQLLQMTARVPFDDRRALSATVEDIRERKVREFLRDVRSGLLDEANTSELFRRMRIVEQVNGYDAPKNIGLLLFSENADKWFRGARIEVVQFAAGATGDVIEERVFFGGIHEQLRMALDHLEGISGTYTEKQTGSFRAKGWASWPIPALREALVNAVYHRGYDGVPEPVKVYLYPDRMEIISYPGPVPGIEHEHLTQQSSMPPAPARNRRIGEFLKELRLAEGRSTGIPKIYKAMRENGSGDPLFEFDAERTWFRTILPAHPEYVAISALRDAAHLRATGNDAEAFRRVEDTWRRMPGSPALTSEYLRLLAEKAKVAEAEEAFARFRAAAAEAYVPTVMNVLIEILVNAEEKDANQRAKDYFDMLPRYLESQDSLDSAILARRIGNQQLAHEYFERARDVLFHDDRALLEFAQTKIKLAQQNKSNRTLNRRLLLDAKELLERVVRMEASPTRHAWAWREIARTMKWLGHPTTEVEAAYNRAIELLPGEERFKRELANWKRRRET
ncbi:MAG: ATP-binding protein [Pseudomonadota bacterium]|nr:ATP-binding protein [Pseudomonadota bacterium]